MAKKIIFCADGTWNHPKSSALVSDCDTNVYKLYKLLAVTATQVPFYDDGVGVESDLLRHLLGGAFGDGLFRKVKDGYTAIAHVYEAGDAIAIFGFSRGAYTARSVAGMIAGCGLPTKGFDQHLVDTTFAAYRNRDQRQQILSTLTAYNLVNASITAVGVWDTVGSLGIPVDFIGLNHAVYGFLDTKLHPDVQSAFHAVAIDERRVEFPATLWTPPFAPGQIVKQAYFTGVHCDVGGGYAETGLSDITLSWMLQKALEAGGNNKLELLPAADAFLTIDPKHALDKAHESWNLIWGFPKHRTIANDAVISNSVSLRIAEDQHYRPPNLNTQNGKLGGSYGTEMVLSPASKKASG